MKYIKNIRQTMILLLPVLFAASCTDWLDGALPKDKNLEEKQFSTEAGINSVLNGIYRGLASNNLYGGRLTMTDMELLAHYYFYERDISQVAYSGYTRFYDVSNYNYSKETVRSGFSSVWNAAYQSIFNINTFIENISNSEALSESKKNVLLGESYGLRAFLHFDLFRIFGDENNGIPYNRSAEVVPHDIETVENFYTYLMQDMDRAIELLQNDPVITDGIKDLASISANDNVTSSDIFARYLRNYRLNYYAAKALKARILMYRGDVLEAATLATDILGSAFGDGKPFNWANKNKILEPNDRNYIFYSEILFGIFNPDLYKNWESWTNGTSLGSTYAVHINNLQGNIFKNDNAAGDLSLWEDIRTRQWMPSKIGGGQYVSAKFEHFTFSANNPKEYFQPLIRTAELHYIIIESLIGEGQLVAAMKYLNEFRFMRGSQYSSLPDPENATETELYDILETEYYKEFYGEGQAFFYLKRRKSDEIFRDDNEGKTSINSWNYIVPLPENEISN
ncbi:MAG: RagB/SusD family nutrient uptake outer membrane protein [Prevotellaceae bacterium]|jgi:hypothetical protein|nr:RagB/SusD family nutrient uptake outer membrane protein [Prevotellaceae bacterium]